MKCRSYVRHVNALLMISFQETEDYSAGCLRGKRSRRRTDYEKAVPSLRWLVAGFEPRPGHGVNTIGFWRWCITHRDIGFSDFVRKPNISAGHGGFVVDKVALRQVFLLRFPLPIIISPTGPHSSSSIIRGWYNRPINGRRTKWTQCDPTPRN
jgi:hypothetical protein